MCLNSFQIALLKRAVEKFKSQLAVDNSSVCSDPSPKNSLTYHRITPISPTSYQMQQGDHKRVTTSAIVSHENDGSKGQQRGSKSSRLLHHKNSSASLNTVKWKDSNSSPPTSTSASVSTAAAAPPTMIIEHSAALKEVNVSLSRLDRKILHLEDLLAKLTDKLSQQAMLEAAVAKCEDEENETNEQTSMV